MALSPQWLDELKSRITLSTLINRTTKLQRAGREWKACCPFHNEATPSFTVNDQKGFYHCFGCQAHGGAIDWLMEQRGLEFMDAVKELAAQAGMDVPAPDPRAAKKAEQRATLHDVMQAAQGWFAGQLRSPAGEAARAYLDRRGFDPRTIERFGFGFAPDDRQAMRKALGDFDDALLIEAGLLIKVEDKLPYARFRGRVMLPIQDARERVIAFGGRILEDREGVAKYLNSPDTPLFDKGRTLYNIHRAAAASRKTGRVVVVEGYMDVIALAAAGIEDAVAPMGTALTEQQIELLWRMADKPVLCLDGDQAGRRAAMRAAERTLPLLRPGHSLRIATLPAGMDPDDLVSQRGSSAMENLIRDAKTLEDFIWEFEVARSELNSTDSFSDLKARLLGHGEGISDRFQRKHLEERFLTRFFALRRSHSDHFRKQQDNRKAIFRKTEALTRKLTPVLQRVVNRDDNLRKLTAAVLNGLARFPHEIHRHADSLLKLASGDPQLVEAVDYLLERAETLEDAAGSPISHAGILPPPPDKARFSFLVEGSDPDDAREDLAEAVSLLVERPALEAAIVAATARFADDPEGAFAEQQRLRKRKLEIELRLGQMARKRAAPAHDTFGSSSGAQEAAGDERETD
ncbi:DNA primase [Aurantiacibacter spongiae]|uniref:DNA primase n=1 Tax=Aurantiacibacter spongiae TaxID=2488860 RepID=A0A3N5CSD8_9SPHN|nr:DNA primase [Aurantiacibacter spongiae]RPF70220.1 DNA primase [Aurantiacibacter spongiae]